MLGGGGGNGDPGQAAPGSTNGENPQHEKEADQGKDDDG